MPKNNFWDLTYRPYTQLKLRILNEYLHAWTTIFFSISSQKHWHNWQEVYYVDCFAGRGKYHKNRNENSVDGSPLLALKCASEFQRNSKYKGVKMKCIFVENDKNVAKNLREFCESYEDRGDYEIYEDDFNNVIAKIINETNYHPAFFFVDPDGIKELKKESIETIVNRKGPTDILLNYIKGGVERIAGLAKKKLPEILNQTISSKDIKTIKNLTDFYGLNIFDKFDATERERLKEWTESIFRSSCLKDIAVFDMPYLHKSDIIYYLLFASKKPVAKKIILQIFRKAKKTSYRGQGRLNIFSKKEFEL
jgi:three-Cys-motif partner protein